MRSSSADGGLEGSTTEGSMSDHEGGSLGAAQFSVRTTGQQTREGASGGVKHRGFYGGWQDQGGVGLPCAVVLSSAGGTVPPHQ